MVDRRDILELAERIAREFQPERIILFGSHAYGSPRADSDVDLLVVLPYEGSAVGKAVEILKQMQPPFGVDLVVRSPQHLRQRLEWNDPFLREAVERGTTLYAAPDRGVG